ncbi:uncharacterized protein LOC144767301 [Lissotriton helveticus]
MPGTNSVEKTASVTSEVLEIEWDVSKLDEYKKDELIFFAKRFKVPRAGCKNKTDYYKALKAWIESRNAPEDQELPDDTGVPDKEGSIHSFGRGLSPEELADRKETRNHEMKLAELNLKGQLELESKRMALEERKLQLEFDVKMREMSLKEKALDHPPSGGSTTPVQVESRVHIPKDVVKEFFKGDDIGQWFRAYEVAMLSHRVPERDWGAGLWGRFLSEGRDTLLDLPTEDQRSYPPMKEALMTRYGLTPEMYRQKFRGCNKRPGNTYVEFVTFFCRALDGWVKGNKVNDFQGLFDLIAWEHLSDQCFPELRQHLIDSKLSNPRKLAEEADRWLSTRVHKGPVGDSAKEEDDVSEKVIN